MMAELSAHELRLFAEWSRKAAAMTDRWLADAGYEPSDEQRAAVVAVQHDGLRAVLIGKRLQGLADPSAETVAAMLDPLVKYSTTKVLGPPPGLTQN